MMVLAAAAVGCGGSESEDASQAGPNTALGAFATLEFTVTPGAEPFEGVNSFRVDLRDAATDAPFAGASLQVTPVMRSMGHEAPGERVVDEQAEGSYGVENVVFSMPGAWDMRLRAARGDVFDEAVFLYEVR
jgi:hypothetical protein